MRRASSLWLRRPQEVGGAMALKQCQGVDFSFVSSWIASAGRVGSGHCLNFVFLVVLPSS